MVPELIKSLRKHKENDKKLLPKFFKYIGNIETVALYEKFKKEIFVSLAKWFIDIQIRAFIFFVVFICLSASLILKTTPNKILLAEGSSIIWYLLIELKKDLWRK